MESSEISDEGRNLVSEHEKRESYSDYLQEQYNKAMLKEARTETQGGQSRPIYCYISKSPKAANNNNTSNPSFHKAVLPADHCVNHFINQKENPSYYTMLCMDTIARNEYPSHYSGIRRRKSREQVRKENHSALVIQSAWRGFQVRKQIKEMNEAATKIQSCFRGFRIRQELNLYNSIGIHSQFMSISTYEKDNRYQKNEGIEKYNTIGSELQHNNSNETYYQHSTLSFETQNSSMYPLSINGSKLREDKEIDSVSQISKTSSSMQEFSLESFNNVKSTINSITCCALSSQTIAETSLQCQENQLDATHIQAEWKGYQVRRQIRDTTHPYSEKQVACQRYKNRLPHSSNGIFSIKGHQKQEAAVNMVTCSSLQNQNSGQVLAFGHGDSAQGKLNLTKNLSDSSISISANRKTNIMVMEAKPPSRMPLISITVKSPNAVVHGYCRDTTTGAQGHYNIKSKSATTISQLSIQVNVLKKS